MTGKEPTVSEETWQTVRDAPVVRPAQVQAGRARVVSGDWPSPVQVADVLLAGWFRRLGLHP